MTVACPPECDPLGTVRECEARQLALFVEERHDVPHPAIITGDMNSEPDSIELLELRERGWIDSFSAVKSRRCSPEDGVGCTGGRDEIGGELEDPALNLDTRIDFILIVPPGEGSNCAAELQPEGTGPFAAEPNPFADACGPAPLPICWTSDHSGNLAEFSCDRTPSGPGDGPA